VDNIKMDLRETGCGGMCWINLGTSEGFLWTWLWTFGFHKMLGSSWVGAQLAPSQEGLSFMKLVAWLENEQIRNGRLWRRLEE
jgi:hypothetical protein